jgi:hypothetical protein
MGSMAFHVRVSNMPVSANVSVLSWLADAPVFIDRRQIDAFYDAVVGPAFRTVQLELSAGQTEQMERSSEFNLNAGLSALFPWLKISADAEAHRTRAIGVQSGQNIVLQPVESAARQLVQLSLHYTVNQENRICIVAEEAEIPHEEEIGASPRMLAFVDVPPAAKLLPQAAELSNGRVVTFFDPLIEKLQQDGGTLPVAYPESIGTDEGKRQRDAHWKWYADHWNLDKVVKVVEDAIGDGGPPQWIDYRMTFGTGKVLHLHVVAHGEYDTDVFSYNLIRRGERYGLRMVGSLKSQPALNVLAVYEKLHGCHGARLGPHDARAPH